MYDVGNQEREIKELKSTLSKAIVPKFKIGEHIYGFAPNKVKEIEQYTVTAYKDNNTTLCENLDTGYLEWCDNQFLARTFEEAQAKLDEIRRK